MVGATTRQCRRSRRLLGFRRDTLTVNDHVGDIAKIKFFGTFATGSFHISNDGGGGTLLTE